MILNKVDDLICWADPEKNCILLGTLERDQLLIAFHSILNLPVESRHINSGATYYKGFRLIPVELPSFMALATVTSEQVNPDATIKVTL